MKLFEVVRASHQADTLFLPNDITEVIYWICVTVQNAINEF